jgi:hypothetical protein
MPCSTFLLAFQKYYALSFVHHNFSQNTISEKKRKSTVLETTTAYETLSKFLVPIIMTTLVHVPTTPHSKY